MKKSILLCLLLAATPIAAQPTTTTGGKRLTIDDVLRWRIASSPVVSPDGNRAAFLVDEANFEKSQMVTHLWWVDTTTGQSSRLTHTDSRLTDPHWAPNGQWISFLAARGPDAEAQVWLLPVTGGEAFPLTDAPEGVLQYAWAPDSRSVYYVAALPRSAPAQALLDRGEQSKQDHSVVDEYRPRREIWRIQLEEQQADRVYAGDSGVDEFAVSPDGRWIVFRTNGTGDVDDGAKFNLMLLDVAAHRASPLTTRGGEERSPVWSPDSLRVAFLAPQDETITYSQEEVFVVPLPAPATASGAAPQPVEPQRLTQSFSGAIERLYWPKGNDIYFAAAVRTENRLFRFDAATGNVSPASGDKFFLTDANWNSDGSVCVALQEGPLALPELAVLRPATALVEPQKLTDLNPQLKGFALGAQDVVRWKGAGGLEIEGIVTRPAGFEPGKKYPLLLDVHGGPHNRRANTMTTGHYAQLFAARGWLVLQPNFRGSTAYGHEFDIANRGDLGGKDAEDILAGVDSLIAQGVADPERLAVMGESYGGYMTNWLIARTQRFRAAASLFGIFNFITDYSNSEISTWEKDYLGKYYWEDPNLYMDRSPAKYAADIRTPVLILHGDADTNTFISNSQEMYRALQALGRTVRFVRFPREGHGFVEPNHIRSQYQEILAWLDAHVLSGAGRSLASLETARAGAWELRLGAIRTPEDYGGLAPKGRFVEVELFVEAAQPTNERFSLLVFDSAGSEVKLESVDTARGVIYPEGLVSETLGQRLLIKSQGHVVAIQPDRNGAHSTLAITVAFDAPGTARQFLLRVKDFPAMRIELPADPESR